MHFDAFHLLCCPLLSAVCVLCKQTQYKNTSPSVEVSKRVLFLIHQWAPKIWIHPQERYLPSSVNDYLKEVILKKLGCSTCSYKASKLPTGSRSANYYLTTKTEKEQLLWNETSILYGTNVTTTSVPVYAVVSTCDFSYKTFIVTYWTFYPFNEGKEVCSVKLGKSKALPVIKLFNKCLGKSLTYGSHIGDWEHMTLEFKNFVPSRMFLSVHNIGVYYKYNQISNQFVISSGLIKGLTMVRDPPSVVKVEEGHPVLFAAKGSHGLWGDAGAFKYTQLSLSQLVDRTGYGLPWKTWEELQVFFPSDVPLWYRFRGRWGNSRTGCLHINKYVSNNVCMFSDGPQGLFQRLSNISCK